jgi:DNA-directed RNA polymerase specialized sigma24 family protein
MVLLRDSTSTGRCGKDDGTFKGYDEDEQEKRAAYRLRRDLIRAMEKFARQEKAQRIGYSANDEAFYNEGLIAEVLPAVLRDEKTPPQTPSEGRGNADPAEGGSWMAHLLDIAAAWEEAPLVERERDALILYYGFGKNQTETGELIGCDQATVARRLSSGMKKIIATLGGSKPGGCPYDCECHEGKLRVRPGIHSEISGKNQELR